MIQLFVYNNNNINKEGAIIIQITAIFFGGVIIHGHYDDTEILPSCSSFHKSYPEFCGNHCLF